MLSECRPRSWVGSLRDGAAREAWVPRGRLGVGVRDQRPGLSPRPRGRAGRREVWFPGASEPDVYTGL